jgi:hypothetical protein
MKHGQDVGGGYKIGDAVRINCPREHVVGASAVVTGRHTPLIRVRVRIGMGTVTLFVRYSEMEKDETQNELRREKDKTG